MNDTNRKLEIYADDVPVPGITRAQLLGRDTIGLYPMCFTLRLWNLSDDGYYRLLAAKHIAVMHEDSVLAAGSLSDVYRFAVPEGTIIEAVFSATLALWEAPVSLSVAANTKVSDTVREILAASGTGVSLLSFPGEDQVVKRGQAFFGRTSECVMTAISAAGARCCLTPSGLCVIPADGLPVSMLLSDADLIDAPVTTPGGLVVLRTVVTGWPLGKMISVSWRGKTVEGTAVERCLNADNGEGCWESELVLEVRT